MMEFSTNLTLQRRRGAVQMAQVTLEAVSGAPLLSPEAEGCSREAILFASKRESTVTLAPMLCFDF